MKIIDSTPDKFRSVIKGHKTFCFGGGDYFKLFCFDFGNDAIIAGVIDNDIGKQGSLISAGAISANVYSIAEISATIDFSEIILVITSSAYLEIIDQLQALSDFGDTVCYVYAQIKYSQLKPISSLSALTRTYSTPQIPKIIHYCWFGGNKLPEILNKCIDSWREFCPDYEIVEWNEGNYDCYKNAWTRTAFEQSKWAHLADYARIDIINKYGGIYLDTDVELLKNLDDLRYTQGFTATEAHGGVNCGSGFGAIAKQKVFSEMLEYFEHEIENGVAFCSNVGRETEAFWQHGYKLNGEYQVIKEVAMLPFNVMTPIVNDTSEKYFTDATIGIHYFNRGWLE